MVRPDKQIARDPGAVPRRVVYVGGSNYSGSTLLAMLLNALPGVVSIGEMGPDRSYSSGEYPCSCGLPVARCQFFREVAALMAERGTEFDPADMHLRLSANLNRASSRLLLKSLGSSRLDALRDGLVAPLLRRGGFRPELRRRTENFVEAVLEVAEAEVFVDTTKSVARIPFLTGCTGLNTSVLHLVRDPRAQVHSARLHQPGISVARHARSWVRRQRAIERHLAVIPQSKRLVVRYEDLCRQPEIELRRVQRLLRTDSILGWARYAEEPHHIIGNRMRTRGDRDSRVRLDEKWRTGMSGDDQAKVMRLAGAQARRYSYTDSSEA